MYLKENIKGRESERKKIFQLEIEKQYANRMHLVWFQLGAQKRKREFLIANKMHLVLLLCNNAKCICKYNKFKATTMLLVSVALPSINEINKAQGGLSVETADSKLNERAFKIIGQISKINFNILSFINKNTLI